MPTAFLIAPTALSVVCALSCLLAVHRARRTRRRTPQWWTPPPRRRHALRR